MGINKKAQFGLLIGLITGLIIISILLVALFKLNSATETSFYRYNSSSEAFIGDYNVDKSIPTLQASNTVEVYNNTWLNFDGVVKTTQTAGINLTNLSQFSPYRNDNKTTISFWIKIDSDWAGIGTDGRRMAITKLATNDFEYEFRVRNYSSQLISMQDAITFTEYVKDGSSVSSVACIQTYELNKWYFCSIVLNYSSKRGYGNSRFIENIGVEKLNNNGSSDLLLGHRLGTPINGSIDDFRYYTEPLNPISIREIYKEGGYHTIENYLPVLMLHQYVDGEANSDLKINETILRDLMEYFRINNYTTITDYEYYQWRNNNFTMPNNPVMMIWDDANINQWINAARVMSEYNQKAVIALFTLNIENDSTANWTGVRTLVNDYGWTIASHTDTHCSLGGINSGSCTSSCFCNETTTMQGNLSLSYSKIFNNTGYEPITLVHPYNDWTVQSMGNASLYYKMAFGSAASGIRLYESEFIDKESGFFNGDLKRIGFINTTNNETIDYIFNKNYNLNSIVGKWKFNEATGTTAYDTSGNDNHGTIAVGATWQNDTVRIGLTEDTDYTVNSHAGLFKLINSAYDKSYIMLSYTFLDPSLDTTGGYQNSQNIKGAGSAIGENLGLVSLITVFALIMGLLVTFFIGKIL